MLRTFKKFSCLFLILMLAGVLSGCGSSTPTPPPTPMPAISYEQVIKAYRSNMTDLQRADYNKQNLFGHKVEWSGWMISVKDKPGDSRYRVITLDMTDDTKEIGGKIYLVISRPNLTQIPEYNAKVYFSGIVDSSENDNNLIVTEVHLLPNPTEGTFEAQSYSEIIDAFQRLENRTWVVLKQNAIGAEVQWEGVIRNVDEQGNVIMASSADDPWNGIVLSGLPQEAALALKIGANYKFTARITSIKEIEKTENYKQKKFVTVNLKIAPPATPTPAPMKKK